MEESKHDSVHGGLLKGLALLGGIEDTDDMLRPRPWHDRDDLLPVLVWSAILCVSLVAFAGVTRIEGDWSLLGRLAWYLPAIGNAAAALAKLVSFACLVLAVRYAVLSRSGS